MGGAASTSCMNIFKQEGGADCALFAMAVITSLALGNDPLQEVYQQGQLRSHYLNILECGNIKPFPLLRTRRRPRNAHHRHNDPLYTAIAE